MRNPLIAAQSWLHQQAQLAALPAPTATGHDSTTWEVSTAATCACLWRIVPSVRACAHAGDRSSAARNCWDHRDLCSFRDVGVEALREPDVLIADVHVDESAQLPGVIQCPSPDTGKCGVKTLNSLADRSRFRRYDRVAAGVGAQNRRDSYRDRHAVPASRTVPGRSESSSASNASSVAGIGARAGMVSATASGVLRPSPELMMTVRAPGSI